MSNTTYTIKIKKEYASAIIKDLKQVDAIEIVKYVFQIGRRKNRLKDFQK
jgi:hypothetical protein